MSNEQTLLKMKNEIEQAKNQKSRLEGERDGILAQLKKKNLNTVDEARAKVKELSNEIAEEQKLLDQQIESLRGAYNWKTL
mgnify:CR=1 FL=1